MFLAVLLNYLLLFYPLNSRGMPGTPVIRA